jgi:mannose-6-phosphate isomerase
MLQWFDARPGDTFFIPAGTVHAIGPGLTMCEIQQNSDITYRLYDYGRPRELHLDHGIRVSHRHPYDPRSSAEVSCTYFQTGMIGSGDHRLNGAFAWLVVIGGEGAIDGKPAREGEVWHVPAERSVNVAGDLQILAATTLALSAVDE